MRVCSSGHAMIVHEDGKCPLCAARETIELAENFREDVARQKRFLETELRELKRGIHAESAVALKWREEIQRAHDMLSAVVLREVNVEVPVGFGLVVVDLELLSAQCDVLCWILEHDHNFAFENNLKALRAEFDRRGIVEQRAEAI